jgi:DNA-binding cell septation regulator SpoVG
MYSPAPSAGSSLSNVNQRYSRGQIKRAKEQRKNMEQTNRFGKKDQAAQAHKLTVERVHQFDDGSITFNLTVDGFVTIYGCRIYDGKDGKPFISFPARKGNDGKYWNHAYIKLSDEQTEDVAKQVEEKLA